MATKAPSKVRPGFTRVLIPERNKTIQIRTKNALNQNYMTKHGLVAIPEPKQPPTPEAPMYYAEPAASLTNAIHPAMEMPTSPVMPKVTKAAPVKQKANG